VIFLKNRSYDNCLRISNAADNIFSVGLFLIIAYSFAAGITGTVGLVSNNCLYLKLGFIGLILSFFSHYAWMALSEYVDGKIWQQC
jgi:hypothetical protein